MIPEVFIFPESAIYKWGILRKYVNCSTVEPHRKCILGGVLIRDFTLIIIYYEYIVFLYVLFDGVGTYKLSVMRKNILKLIKYKTISVIIIVHLTCVAYT